LYAMAVIFHLSDKVKICTFCWPISRQRCAQRCGFFLDSENPSDKKLEMRSERNQQLRFLLGCQSAGVLAGELERLVQRGLLCLELRAEQRIEPHESTALVEVRKTESCFG